MKFIAAASSLMLSIAAAQTVQSKPFHLVLSTSDKSLNGKSLTACHSGAAIETLCVVDGSSSSYNLNTTKGETSPLKGYEPSGILTWILPSTPISYSEPMVFSVDPGSNVALPIFEPGYDSQEVTFDSKGVLNIFSYVDDTVSPPKSISGKAINNWYVCDTYYGSYTYSTLAWALGAAGAKPQNPSCKKVDVKRVWA